MMQGCPGTTQVWATRKSATPYPELKVADRLFSFDGLACG